MQIVNQYMMRQNRNIQNNTDYLRQANKRHAFAQQIRKRDRSQKLKQFRIDFSIREKAWNILSAIPIDSYSLYNFMEESKLNESNSALVIIEWLQSKQPILQIESKKECLHWGYILSTAILYHTNICQLILIKYFPTILTFSKSVMDLQIVFVIILSVISIMDLNSSKQKCQNQQKQINQLIDDAINQSLGGIIEGYDKMRMGINELKFYYQCFRKYNDKMCKLARHKAFLIRVGTYFEQSLTNMSNLSQLTKLLTLITFYDNSHQSPILNQLQASNIPNTIKPESQQTDCLANPTQYLVQQTELRLLENIKFVLDFIEKQNNQNLHCSMLFLVQNIIKNGFAFAIIQNGMACTIQAIIQQTQQLISLKIRRSACSAYLALIQHIYNEQKLLDFVTQTHSIQTIVHIVNKYAYHNNQLLEGCCYAIENLLNIGEQIRIQNNSSINCYMLKLKYDENVLKQHEAIRELLEKFRQN